MKLADYLAREGLSQKEFADRAGLSTGTVSLLVRDLVGISAETLQKLIAASDGKVSEKDYEPVVYKAAE